MKYLTQLKFAAKKYAPEILTGIGISGMVLTTVLAVRATPKALDILNEVKEEHPEPEEKKELAKDIVTRVFPCYIPATITGVCAVACVVSATAENNRRNAALVAMSTLTEEMFKDYREAVIQEIGPRKEERIRDTVAVKQIERNPVSQNDVFVGGKGKELCYDPIDELYFMADADIIRSAVNKINTLIIKTTPEPVELNELWYEMGHKLTNNGSNMFFNIDHQAEVYFTSAVTDDERACLVVNFFDKPTYEYGKVNRHG